MPCAPGTLNNVLGASECDPCTAGLYCVEWGMSEGETCFQGHYCPEGSHYPAPCPIGTYTQSTTLVDWSECTVCDRGSYCAYEGLTQVTGNCNSGHICGGGSTSPNPNTKLYDAS
jgi:hypothetical protein